MKDTKQDPAQSKYDVGSDHQNVKINYCAGDNVIKKKKALYQCPLLWVDGLNQVCLYRWVSICFDCDTK